MRERQNPEKERQNMVKTKEEVMLKLDTLKAKAQESNLSPEKKAQAEAVIAQIEKLNSERTEEPEEIPDFPKPDFPKPEPKAKTPKFKIKKPSEEELKKQKSIKIKVTEEQVNALTFAATSGLCMVLKKEDMKPEDTKTFSSVLYEVGDQNGWWDKIEFLPYLILLGAGFELSMKIINKPSKIPAKITEQKVIEQIERNDNEMKNNDFGKVDVIDQDLLIKKLGGNNIYKNQGSVENEI